MAVQNTNNYNTINNWNGIKNEANVFMSILFIKARKEKEKKKNRKKYSQCFACLLTVVRMWEYGIQSDKTKKSNINNVV